MEYHLRTRRLTGIYRWPQSSCSVFGGLTAHCSLPHRVISVNQLLHGPRNSVRCFLTAATLDCFARSNVTLLLCLHENFNDTGCRHVVFWLLTDLISSSNLVDPSSHATLTKGSRTLGTLLASRFPQNTDAHG